MGDIVDVRVFGGDGYMWSGDQAGLARFLAGIARENTAVSAMAGLEALSKCTKNDVMRAAEELNLVSRHGMSKGFLVTLPAGKVFEGGVDAFNLAHLEALNVSPVEFPLVFDSGGAAMGDLIRPYHLQGRTFALADHEELRLSYAADPNLFAWLQGRRLDPAQLPYAVYSPQPVFRNFRTGELSIQRTRQFTVPDIHILTSLDDAGGQYLHALRLAVDSTRFWFGDDYLHVLDSVVGSRNDSADFYARAGKAAGGITIVRRLAERPKYYAQKTGVLVWSGYDNVMLYNLQMDEVNPIRFDIRLADGSYPAVIHACVAMGMSRMLPLILGRGISGIAPKVLPVELSAVQVALVPIGPQHVRRAEAVAQQLYDARVRASIDADFGKSIGARLWKLRKNWQSHYAVIGDREDEQLPLIQDVARATDAISVDDFLRVHGERIRRCTSHHWSQVRSLPFIQGD